MAAESQQVRRSFQIPLADLSAPVLDEKQRVGVYANAYSVAMSGTEVFIDFMLINPAPGRLGEVESPLGETKMSHVARVIVSPAGARRLHELLGQFVRVQESEGHGEREQI